MLLPCLAYGPRIHGGHPYTKTWHKSIQVRQSNYAEGTPVAEAPPSAQDRDPADPGTDTLLAQYCGEVRRFALLSFAEEQALGRRITRWQRRVHWALYTAPVALPILRRLWQQVEQEAIPLHGG